MEISAKIPMDRPEVQYFTPPVFLTSRLPICIWPPSVVWYSYLRRLCLTCIIEVIRFSSAPCVDSHIRSPKVIFSVDFPSVSPKVELCISTWLWWEGNLWTSSQRSRSLKGKCACKCLCSRAVTMVCAWSALAQRLRTFCEAPWHRDLLCSSWVSFLWQPERDLE